LGILVDAGSEGRWSDIPGKNCQAATQQGKTGTFQGPAKARGEAAAPKLGFPVGWVRC